MKRFLPLLLICILTGCCRPAEPTTAPVTTVPETTAVSVPPTETAQTTEPEETLPPPDPLEVLLEGMSTEEKVGQLFLARCPDVNALADISAYHLGGYLLFGRDFDGQTPESVREILQSYQDQASIPMLIAVDEEGGTVCRVSSQAAFRSSRFASPRNLFEAGGLKAVLETETEKCQLLRSLGINVNLAPVCDITTDPSAFMYSRSLGQDPVTTAGVIRAMVSLGHEQNMGMALKHFPGYGNNADTHVGVALDLRSLDELEQADLKPFAAGIQAGCQAILVSHTVIACLDPELPATLSPAVHQYLRETMGYNGVILTDDLVMQAITDTYGAGEAAVLAVLAGNDLLCSTNYPEEYAAVLAAVADGRIPEARLDEAVLRVLRWKAELNLLPLT